MSNVSTDRPPIQDVTQLESTVLYTPIKGIDKKSVFLVNEGSSPITYKTYTSPSGIRTTDRKWPDRTFYTESDVAKEWAEIDTGTLNSGAKIQLGMDLVTANFVKVTAFTPAGYAYVGAASQIRTWFQGIDSK